MVSRLLAELSTMLQTFGHRRLPSQFSSLEAKGSFFLSLLAGIIEEDRLRIYDLETIITQMAGIRDRHQLPAELEEAVRRAKVKLQRPKPSSEQPLAHDFT